MFKTPDSNNTLPLVLRFKAQLLSRPKDTIAVKIPTTISKEFSSLGITKTKAEGVINNHPFRSPMEADKHGDYWLQINRAMLKVSDAKIGDTVKLTILGPEPDLEVPTDLQDAFRNSKKAQKVWNELTSIGQRDWVRWINLSKKPETRTKRIRRTIEQLAEGKRRACCVNIYEFMLYRIRESEE